MRCPHEITTSNLAGTQFCSAKIGHSFSSYRVHALKSLNLMCHSIMEICMKNSHGLISKVQLAIFQSLSVDYAFGQHFLEGGPSDSFL